MLVDLINPNKAYKNHLTNAMQHSGKSKLEEEELEITSDVLQNEKSKPVAGDKLTSFQDGWRLYL